jgi:hypothetical protein
MEIKYIHIFNSLRELDDNDTEYLKKYVHEELYKNSECNKYIILNQDELINKINELSDYEEVKDNYIISVAKNILFENLKYLFIYVSESKDIDDNMDTIMNTFNNLKYRMEDEIIPSLESISSNEDDEDVDEDGEDIDEDDEDDEQKFRDLLDLIDLDAVQNNQSYFVKYGSRILLFVNSLYIITGISLTIFNSINKNYVDTQNYYHNYTMFDDL